MTESVGVLSVSDRIRLLNVETLSDDWYILKKKTTFDWLRSDGSWQRQNRETYDRGNGAVLLPYDPHRGTVLLTRQFRYPAYVNSHNDLLIEAAAGLLDEASPEERIRIEVQEELGLRLNAIKHIFTCFMSPGLVTEKLFFHTAHYDSSMRRSPGGGNPSEGEDIEVIEVSLKTALGMLREGSIRDAKTVILIQHLALSNNLGGNSRPFGTSNLEQEQANRHD